MHKNGDSLDYQIENLEILTRKEFAHKYVSRAMKSRSKYRNVSWDENSNKWKVRIIYEGNIYEKFVDSETDAAVIADYISYCTYRDDENYNFIYTDHTELLDSYKKMLLKYGENSKAIRQRASQGNKRKGTYSKFLGVGFDERRKKWTARIKKDGKTIWLGSFIMEIDAARAYDEAAAELYGEYAKLNFRKI